MAQPAWLLPGDPPLELVGDAGPRFLLVHGANGSAAVWRQLAAALAVRGAASLAVSLRGHGASGGQTALQSFGIRDYVADVRRVLAALPVPPVLVGHSMGGLVAQLVAAEAPLAGLALLASSPTGGMRRDGARMLLRHPFTFLRAIRRRSFRALYAEPRLARALLFARATPEAVIRDYQAMLGEESWRAGTEMNELLPDPGAVRCPVLVIGGAEDAMVSPGSVRRTASAYRTAAVLLPGRAHMLQLEGDQDALAALLLSGPWTDSTGRMPACVDARA
ncbi:alpha/beta fold hydrolase [Falsiroseomonas oryziterrae]|uniref:alpha/beta fold hydrolase n=1 Tax=Falsiroseomonas oryziterrae TaxID=2911368 RepID=UPI001F362700|nr:alpha/beta fold hydrolase [Roseomonas sp. NPKOSM-4]